MLEKDIENLIAQYPDEFFPNSGFSLKGQQVTLGRCCADVVFVDKYNRTIIIEIREGILSREASGEVVDYYDLLKKECSIDVIELVLCANVIPHQRKVFLESAGVECKELSFAFITNVAKKHGYRFLDANEEPSANKQRKISIKAKNKQKVWIFQVNPKRYDIFSQWSNSNYTDDVWQVNQHKDEIKKGDIALIWVSGSHCGIYAVADIISDPANIRDLPEEEKYWISEEDKGKNRLRVRITIVKNLINNPLFRSELKAIKELNNLSILRFSQATNFPVTHEEWQIIETEIDRKLRM